MTIQTAVNSACLRVLGVTPAAVFSSDDQVVIEMRDLAQDVASDIARSNDWRDLTQIATFAGDGVSEVFPKPEGYDRMVQGTSIVDPVSWFWGYFPVNDISTWLRRKRMAWISPGGWILLSDGFNFYPAPSGDAEFPFISNRFVVDANGVRKDRFDADTDTFVLSEDLLTLGLIWRYKAQKGLDYSEDMANFERHLSELQARDRGARTIRVPARINPFGAHIAWPWSLG